MPLFQMIFSAAYPISITGLALISVLNLLVQAGPAYGQDCPRGSLDNLYCDRNGDLVADLPEEQGDWADPRTLIFSYTPVEDPAVYARVWDGFIEYLSDVTGRRVMFFPVQSYAAQYEAMRSGRLHVAGINVGGNPVAVNCAGYVPFAMMAADDGSFGYEMEIIVPANSPIQSPADIRGKTMAFTSPTSNSGFKAPSALLKSEFGLVVDQDFKASFSGKHDNSILGVINRDYEVAAVANSVLKRMIARNAVDPSAYRTIFRSATFPTTSYGHAHNLNPDLVNKIKEGFFSFNWEGTALEQEFIEDDKFVPITYQKDWEVIRKIDMANNVSYECK